MHSAEGARQEGGRETEGNGGKRARKLKPGARRTVEEKLETASEEMHCADGWMVFVGPGSRGVVEHSRERMHAESQIRSRKASGNRR